MERVYLILGASSDLGIALIRKIVETDGTGQITIIAHYNSSCKNIDIIASEYKSIDIRTIQADLSDLEDTNRLISDIMHMNLCPTHIVHFSASAYKFNRLSEMEVQRLNRDMNIQVYSFALICKAFVPHMVQQKYGKIIAMLSAATKGVPPKNTTEYTTVKYALLGLIRSLAADFGDSGININAVSPGMIETKFIKNIGRKIKEFTAENSPQHRNLNVDDVVPVIQLLLSDDCAFMNGTNINVSGFPD